MGRAIRKLAIIAGLAGALCAAMAPAGGAEQDPQARLDQLRERIQAVQEQIDAKQEQHDQISDDLADTQRQIAALEKQLQKLGQTVATRRKRLEHLQAQGEKLGAGLARQLAALARHVRAAYRTGRQGRLQLLLAQDNPATVGRLLGYYQYYAQAQQLQVSGLRDDLAALAANRRAVGAQLQRLEGARAQQTATLADLKQAQGERQTLLAKLENRLVERRGQLRALKHDEAKLEDLIETLARRLSDLPAGGQTGPFANRKGSLIPPVDGPRIARFGEPKLHGRLHWNGVWLGAAPGTPVVAAAAGRVVYIGRMYRYGLVVVLDHGGDYYTVYGHNQSIATQLGAWVDAGEIIAHAGTSGGHRSSGVYFEIRHREQPLNPAQWLRS
ncbi:MAG: peptidoglycan DD-metalloendopeptidase family protein [Salinisphaera sp.]|nr:peptidoglycan DD-metalloendopeptidase family protein [Salinisphaera sp.]